MIFFMWAIVTGNFIRTMNAGATSRFRCERAEIAEQRQPERLPYNHIAA
jgi:hypothetical protein